jgi:hypothetical protein
MRFLLQWSQSPVFDAAQSLESLSWSSLVPVTNSTSSSQLLPTVLASGDSGSAVVARVVTLPSTIDLAIAGGIVVELAGPLPPDTGLVVSVGSLGTGIEYFLRASCNNQYFRGEDSVGPSALSFPASMAPLPPAISDVFVAVPSLPCGGGQAITVRDNLVGTCRLIGHRE